jgi:hypothetical protein
VIITRLSVQQALYSKQMEAIRQIDPDEESLEPQNSQPENGKVIN